jgi:lycopene cyclase domain-containing protein
MHFMYFLSIALFCGPILLIGWKRELSLFKKYERTVVILVAISIPFAGIADYIALHWQTWQFSADSTSNVYFLTLPESYVFSAAVTLLVSLVTLSWAQQADRRGAKSRPKHQARARRHHS